MFYSELLKFIHRTNPFRSFNRRCRRKACIRMQKTCKSHASKRLVAESIFVSVFGFGESHLGTETFGLANLAAFFKLFRTIQMFFKIFLCRLAHANELFAKAERKILRCDIHKDGVLSHLEFSLASIHILFSGIVSGINLEPGKNRPNNSEAGVKEPIVLHLHVEIGFVDFLLVFSPILFGHLDSRIVCVLTVDDPFPNIGRLGIHSRLSRFFI